VVKGTLETRRVVTDGAEGCGKHTTKVACYEEAEFPCHWSAKDGVSYTCWPDSNNCQCPNTSPPQYGCTCRTRYVPP